MRDVRSKGVPDAPPAFPESGDSGKTAPAGLERQAEPTKSRRNLDRTMRQVAARLKRDFAAEIEDNPAAFKRRALHALRIHLPPGPGRPCLDFVTRAVDMRAHGNAWKEIYPCIPDWPNLNPAFRSVAQWTLRAAVRSRRNAARRRKRQRQLIAETKPAQDVSS